MRWTGGRGTHPGSRTPQPAIRNVSYGCDMHLPSSYPRGLVWVRYAPTFELPAMSRMGAICTYLRATRNVSYGCDMHLHDRSPTYALRHNVTVGSFGLLPPSVTERPLPGGSRRGAVACGGVACGAARHRCRWSAQRRGGVRWRAVAWRGVRLRTHLPPGCHTRHTDRAVGRQVGGPLFLGVLYRLNLKPICWPAAEKRLFFEPENEGALSGKRLPRRVAFLEKANPVSNLSPSKMGLHKRAPRSFL